MAKNSFYQVLDPFLIWFYRVTGQAWLDFVIGTFVLAVICLLLGEATAQVVFRFSRKGLGEKMEEADKYQTLSIEALKAGNKEAYEAANKLAKEAFGRSFMHQMALGGAFLWPIPFALAWMQTRFLEVEFPIPGTGWSLGFIGPFIIIYVAAYFLLKRVRKLPAKFRRREAVPDPGLTQSQAGQDLSVLPPLIPQSDKK